MRLKITLVSVERMEAWYLKRYKFSRSAIFYKPASQAFLLPKIMTAGFLKRVAYGLMLAHGAYAFISCKRQF
jgi:hypothetical protein